MFNVVRKIIEEVNTAKDLQSALSIIVSRMKSAINCHVCSIYLLDADINRFVLMATDGLNRQSVGQISMPPSEGLVGFVGTRGEPLNLENAVVHPRYRYFPETGEENYASFLGSPIIYQRVVKGVLVVQQKECRQFSEKDEAFLITVGAQLAGVIAHAEMIGSVFNVSKKDTKFVGVNGAPGIAVGTAVVVFPAARLDSVPDKVVENIDAELLRFNSAVIHVRKDIEALSQRMAAQLRPEEQALFDAYRMMLDDTALGHEVTTLIEDGQWAQGAVSKVVLGYINHFKLMDDDYLRERASDIKDLGRRILAYLQKTGQKDRIYPDKTILVSDELSLSMLGEVPEGKLAGLVSVTGSSNSHVAILARSMGIPTVMAATTLPYTKIDGISLVVDGSHGKVFTNPSDQLCRRYADFVKKELQLGRELDLLGMTPCSTRDGYRMPLGANIGLLSDIDRAKACGAEGIGLYRTEVSFMLNDHFPGEKEQITIYKQQLQSFHPLSVTMRSLDIGGDKILPYFPIKENNPFLGWRGIRVTLDHPDIFLVQIRAMLQASEGLNNLRILLPMISNTHEVDEALRLIKRAWHEVCEEGRHIVLPPIGIMIEVPAAIYQVKELAKKVDFISVGSNDLTQYLLAVDRNNLRVADLYDFLHPSVLRALNSIVIDAHSEGKTISICGEMASDPGAAILLMAMGFNSLSMNAISLPKVKWSLNQIDSVKAKELLIRILSLSSASLVKSELQRALSDFGLSRVVSSTNNI
ncbi:UNVERIFIED_CONTAM: hypothetical protein GTU68_039021 [Idotea baltica]|nr:hypothetical protein [Idotea baltica]